MTECTDQTPRAVVIVSREKEPIRVLHVDDEVGLLKVAKQFLEMEGSFQVDTASSVDEAIEKMKKGTYDAVVSDYQMPGKDGLDLLKDLKANGNNVPFIMFTGKGREEVAVKAWNLGADHYVNKNGDPETVYYELAHCLRSAVKRHTVEVQAREITLKLQAIYQNAVEGISYVSPEESFVYVNKAFADILDCEEDRLVGTNLRRFVDEEDWARIKAETERRQRGEATRYEVVFHRPDGTKRNVMISGSPLFGSDGRFAGTVGIVLDITERKKAEDSLKDNNERLKLALTSAKAGMWDWDLRTNKVSWSDEYYRVYGLEPGSVQSSYENWLKFVHPQDRDKADKQVACAVKDSHDLNIEYRTVWPDGTIHWVSVKGKVFCDADGQPSRMIGISIDVTENKRREEELQSLGLIVESSDDAVIGKSLDGTIISWNSGAQRIYGYTPEEVKGKHISVLVPQELQNEVPDILERIRRGEHVDHYETVRVTKDLKRIDVSLTASPIRDADGTIIGASGIERDITERKKTEEALENSERRYREFADSLPEIAFEADEKGNLTFFNQRAFEILGYSRDDFMSMNIFQFLIPEDRERADENVRKMMNGEKSRVNEYTFLRKDGSAFPALVFSNRIVHEDGKRGLRGLIVDISEQKNTEEKLRESEEKFRKLAEESPNMIFINKKGRVVYANRKAEQTIGYTKEEFYSRDFNFLKLIAPESRELIKSDFAKHMKGEEAAPYEYKLLTRQGRTIDAILTSKLITYDGESAILGTVTDISERRQEQEAVRRSEEQARTLLEFQNKVIDTAIVWIDLLDREGNVTLWNRAAELISGYSREEVVGHKKVWEWLYPDPQYCAKIFAHQRRTIEHEESAFRDFETVIRCKDGTLKTISWYSNNILNENGESAGSIAMGIDVTETRKSEGLLLESRQKFEGLFSGNPEATVYTDPEWRILDINPRFTSLFGYSLDEVKGRYLNDVVVPRDLIEEAKTLEVKAVGGCVYHDTVRLRKDGSLVPVAVSAASISVQGQLTGYIGVYKDISRQKNAEQKLAVMNEKLRVIGGLTRHDVQNKLSIITGNTYLDKKKLMDHPEILESFKDIESACNLIVRIFDFARDYEMLGVEELTYVDVEDSVQKAVSLFSSLNGTKVTNECHGLTVLADSLLRQLFYNLIDNSLKYGQKITRIRIHYEKAGKDQLRLVYEDDGVGIPQDAKPKIFDEGYTTGKGSGYGLYLIKKMMEVYGWTIQETGEPGKGAKFTVTIPGTGQNGKENYCIA